MAVIINVNCSGGGASTGSRELLYVTTLTAQDVANKYIELPEDCDATQAITVVFGSLNAQKGDDWEVSIKDPPELDRIVWDGLGIENVAQVGDKLSITYHKKG